MGGESDGKEVMERVGEVGGYSRRRRSRSLLIQVQKVKVDVALAMDGIEKMLKSQQLTFGFVGVAPSMLILVAFGKWVRGMTRSDGGAKRKAEERKKCWMVVR